MRITTTPLILFCTVFFFGIGFKALAQPNFTLNNPHHTCGPLVAVPPLNGSFTVDITSVPNPGRPNIIITVVGTGTDVITIPMPSSFPAPPVTIPASAGPSGSLTYFVFVSDGLSTGGPKNIVINNFNATVTSVTDNTNPSCSPSNGAIAITMDGTTTAMPFHFQWTGPAGFIDPGTEDLSGLGGGDYTLVYRDSNTPPTQCSLPPIHINDPAAVDFGIAGPAAICFGNGLSVVVSATTIGYTYDVLDGPATVIATKAGDGTTGMAIPVPAAAMTLGPHTLKVRASQGACSPKFNTLTPDLVVNVNPTPTYIDFAPVANVCSNIGIGVSLSSAKNGGVDATSFNIASPIVSNGMTSSNAATGNVAVGDLANDVWKNVSNIAQPVEYTITPTINACPGASFKITVMIDPQPDFNDLIPAPAVCGGIAIGVTLNGQRKGTSVLAASYIIDTINPHGMIRVGGTSAIGPATNTTIQGDKWQNATNAIINVDYIIRPVSGASCAGDPFTISVPITPQPDYTGFTSPTPVCSQAVIGLDLTGHETPGSLTATSFTVTQITPNGATLAGGSPLPTAVPFAITATDLADDQWKNITNGNVTVDYKIVPSVGGCDGNVFTVSAVIIPEPDYNNGNTVVCSDSPTGISLNSLAKVTSVTATAYDISLITPDPALTPKVVPALPRNDRTSAEITNDQWENLTGTAKPVVYEVIPKNGTCVGTLFKVTIMVTPEPDVIDYNSAPGGVCSGDAIGFNFTTLAVSGSVAADSYKINTIVAPGLTVLPGSAAAGDVGLATLIANDKYTNNSSGDLPVTYNITPRNGTCDGDPFNVVVLIVPRPVYIDFSNTAGICATPIGIDLATLKNPGSPDATSFTIQSVTFAGLTKVGAPLAPFPIIGLSNTAIQNDVWSNITASNHDVDYSIIPLNGTCAGILFHVIITIKPQPDYLPTPATICSSVPVGFDLITAKNALSSIADTFTITNINIPVDPNFSATVGPAALNVPLTSAAIANDVWKNTSSGPLSVVYTVVPQTGTCLGAPFDVTITVNPEPAYSNTPLPDICSEDAIGLDLEDVIVPGGVSAASFTFTTSADGTLQPVGTTVTNGTGNNMVIADDQWTNITNAVITLTYTITPKSTDNCDGIPFTVTVKINAQPDYRNYLDDLAPAGVCADPLGIDITTLRKLTSVPASAFDVTLPVNLPQIAGAATPNDLTDDVWENATASSVPVVYHIIPKAGTCVGEEFTVTVTILPSPAYNDFSGPICSKGAVGVNLATLQTSGMAATGFTITDDAPAGITKASTDPTIISDDVWTNLTGAAVPVKYTIIPKAGTCSGAPFFVTITVNPEPVAPLDVPKTICSGDNVNFNLQNDAINLGNSLPLTTFDWIVTDNTNVTGETPGLQTATPTISDNLTNLTSIDQPVVYTVTPKSSNNCVGVQFTVTITVRPKPVVAPGQTAEICSGTAVGYTVFLNPVNMPAGTTFSWQAVPNANITGASTTIPQTGAIITDVLVSLTSGPQIVHYTVTPLLGSCTGAAEDVAVTVNQAYIAEAGPNQFICTDAAPYPLAGSSVSGAASTGKWTLVSNPGDGDIDVKNIYVATPSMAIFTATLPGVYVLQLETDDPGPASVCQKGTDQVTIFVTPKPVINPVPKTICGNDQAAYEIQMTVAEYPFNTVFNWADPDGPTGDTNASGSPGGGVVMGASGTIHINDELRNETNASKDVTYDVTPSVGLCVGDPAQIIITVKPSPVLAFFQTKTICSGEAVDYEILLTPANLPTDTKFSWPDPDGAGSATSKKDVAADPVGTTHIKDTLYHFDPAGLPTTVTYQVISQGLNGCYGRTRDIDIIVKSGATAEAGAAQSICANGVLTLSGASISGAANATWSILSGPAGGLITPLTTIADPSTVTFQSATPGTYKLQLTTGNPTVGTCPAVSDIVVITVKPIGDPSCTGTVPGTCTITANITRTDASCNNNDGSILVDNLVGGTGPYTLTLNGAIVNLPANKTIAGLTADNYTLEIKDALSCITTYNTVINFPGFINHTAPVTTAPDCIGGGTNGKVEFTITDPGTFEFAITNDLILEPTVYNTLGGSLVSANNLARGDYAVWLRPVGAGIKCPTKIPVSILGVYSVSYAAGTSDVVCFAEPSSIVVNNITGAPALPYSYTLTNTSDNSVTSGTISASQALSAFSITGINKGNYSLLITQDQSSLVACPTPINGGAKALAVSGPTGALDTLYVKRAISVPDLPSGSALVGVKPSGLEPYEVRLELTDPIFDSQNFVSDWTEVTVNPQNLKFERSYTNLFAGVYTLGLRDAGGCEKTYVFTLDVDTQLFIPNIFTPNGDGSNEVFYVRNLPADTKLLITNRWGKEVYKTSAYQNDWNGGDTVDGLYYYSLTASGKSFTGWVEILRGQ